MTDLTVRNNTSNQITGDYSYVQTFIGSNKYLTGQTFLNNTGATATFAEGLVVGRIAASEKIVPLDPTATDGSQYPVGVLKGGTSELAAAAEQAVSVCYGGEVNESQISFEGATTLATVVSLKTLRDRLASDTAGIFLVVSDELSEYDN